LPATERHASGNVIGLLGLLNLGATEPETDFPLFLEWVPEDKFPPKKVVTNRYPLEHVEEARVALEEGRILGRAIIDI
jgi:Zn-dependent alcohol dehydrogenase